MPDTGIAAFERDVRMRVALGLESEAFARSYDLRLAWLDLGDVADEWVLRAYPIRDGAVGVARILEALARGRWAWIEGDRFVMGDGVELASGPMPPSPGADAGGGHEPEWEEEVQMAAERSMAAAGAAVAPRAGAADRGPIPFLVGFEDAPEHVGTLHPEGWRAGRPPVPEHAGDPTVAAMKW